MMDTFVERYGERPYGRGSLPTMATRAQDQWDALWEAYELGRGCSDSILLSRISTLELEVQELTMDPHIDGVVPTPVSQEEKDFLMGNSEQEILFDAITDWKSNDGWQFATREASWTFFFQAGAASRNDEVDEFLRQLEAHRQAWKKFNEEQHQLKEKFKTLREALTLAESFVGSHSESWYESGQRNLKVIRDTLAATEPEWKVSNDA